MLKADGFDEAIIGLGFSFGREKVLVYDAGLIVDKLMERDGMDEEEAFDFFNFNIMGSYNGEGMPTFLFRHYDLKED